MVAVDGLGVGVIGVEVGLAVGLGVGLIVGFTVGLGVGVAVAEAIVLVHTTSLILASSLSSPSLVVCTHQEYF